MNIRPISTRKRAAKVEQIEEMLAMQRTALEHVIVDLGSDKNVDDREEAKRIARRARMLAKALDRMLGRA